MKPRIGVNRSDVESVTCMGLDAKKEWSRIESDGLESVENTTPAVSRDISASAARMLSGCFTAVDVHDGLIIEPEIDTSVQSVCERAGGTPLRIPGLRLSADGYECGLIRSNKCQNPAVTG